MTRLIVNADDFGLTDGVNRAILELHCAGVLTSATLMARAAATGDAVTIATSTPTLGVGCHVVLADGEPVSSGLLSLARNGRFYPQLGGFLKAHLSGRIDRNEIEREARAQIEALLAVGLKLTHIDTHKHTHMFPAVLRPVLRAARACGIRVVRNPFEPVWSIAATPGAPFVRRAEVRMIRLLETSFRRVVAEEGFATTDGATGVLATGTLNAQTVTSLLRAMPRSATCELVTHPGYADAALAQANTRLQASRNVEREALQALHQRGDVELIRFDELAPFTGH